MFRRMETNTNEQTTPVVEQAVETTETPVEETTETSTESAESTEAPATTGGETQTETPTENVA